MPSETAYRPSQKTAIAGTLGIGAVIAAAMAIAVPKTMQFEGKKNVTYLDIAKVPTACYGHTGADVGRVGTRWTNGQCRTLLDADVRLHMAGALKCVPGLGTRPDQLAASTVLTVNIGVGGFCRSSIARSFNAGKWIDGCNRFLLYNRAGGRVINGLTNRRTAERKICLKGLT